MPRMQCRCTIRSSTFADGESSTSAGGWFQLSESVPLKIVTASRPRSPRGIHLSDSETAEVLTDSVEAVSASNRPGGYWDGWCGLADTLMHPQASPC